MGGLNAAEQSAWETLMQEHGHLDEAMAAVLVDWDANPTEYTLDLDTVGLNTVSAYEMDGNICLIVWFDALAAEHITDAWQSYEHVDVGSVERELAGDELDKLLRSMMNTLGSTMDPDGYDDEEDDE